MEVRRFSTGIPSVCVVGRVGHSSAKHRFSHHVRAKQRPVQARTANSLCASLPPFLNSLSGTKEGVWARKPFLVLPGVFLRASRVRPKVSQFDRCLETSGRAFRRGQETRAEHALRLNHSSRRGFRTNGSTITIGSDSTNCSGLATLCDLCIGASGRQRRKQG